MPRGTKKVPVPPFPGGVVDATNPAKIPPGQYLASNNWLVRREEGRPRPGYTQLGSTLGDAARVIGFGFRGAVETEANTIVHTTANAYNWTGSAFNSITGTWTSSNDYEHVRFTTFATSGTLRIIRVNEQNAPDFWDGTGSFQDVGGSPPDARDITTVANRVVLFGAGNVTNRVQWSDFNDMATWGASSFVDLSQTPGAIVAGRALGPLTMGIYKDDSVWIGAAQEALVPFQFQMVSRTPGPCSPAALVDAIDAHYWLSHDGVIYRYDGTGTPTAVSTGLTPTIRGLIDFAERRLVHGYVTIGDVNPEVWFFFPRVGTTGPLLDRAVSVDTVTGAAHLHSLANSITAAHAWTLEVSLTWQDLTGTWDTLSNSYSSWNEMSTPSIRADIFGDNAGRVYQAGTTNTDNGTAIAWSVTHGWVLVGDDAEDYYLDGIASYWKQASGALTVSASIIATAALADADSETETTSTFDPSTNSNHLVTFANQRGKWLRVRYSASSVINDVRYRGSLVMGWPRRMA